MSTDESQVVTSRLIKLYLHQSFNVLSLGFRFSIIHHNVVSDPKERVICMLSRVNYPHIPSVTVFTEHNVDLVPHLKKVHLMMFVLSCSLTLGLVQEVPSDVIL